MSEPDSPSPQCSPVHAEAVGSPPPLPVHVNAREGGGEGEGEEEEEEGVGPQPYGVQVEAFGGGSRVRLHTPALRVALLSRGAAVASVRLRDPRTGRWRELCLGYDAAAECEAGGAAVGATCGRFAGRIAGAAFALNGSAYALPRNDGAHCLHGGPGGFQRQQWKYIATEGEEEVGVAFHLTAPHLDQGFPGELFVTATYTIPKHAANPTLKYVYQANLSDSTPVSATVVNLTNHTYWNLNGVPRAGPGGDRDRHRCCERPLPIDNHLLQVRARYIAALDEQLVPTGAMMAVSGTPYDYTQLRCIRDGMEATRAAGREPWGFDDPIALETWDSTLREAVVLYSPETKLRMTVHTTNPAVVLYTANFLPADADGSPGQRFQQHSGVCVECQYFPNSPNIDSFPTTTLRKGETYSETTTHEFKFLAAEPSGCFEPSKAPVS